jgi:hypothetical protein
MSKHAKLPTKHIKCCEYEREGFAAYSEPRTKLKICVETTNHIDLLLTEVDIVCKVLLVEVGVILS